MVIVLTGKKAFLYREKVRSHLAELEHCLLALDKKIDGYCSHPVFDKTGGS
ncbi:hypothetical protein [Budvicia diplopodorum]|uniref:hypothetical protein n=1 Tax=Budvicia diplopodorum TaxID=1119056 RepID=UPI00135A7F92|nr:hypothetical protein [Budvicia diplopodorum]